MFAFSITNNHILVISDDIRPKTAKLYCLIIFNVRLLRIRTQEFAIILAEALSETDHYLDNIWTSGFKINNKWQWSDNDVVDQDLLDKYCMKEKMKDNLTLPENVWRFVETQSEPRFFSISCTISCPAIRENGNKPLKLPLNIFNITYL